MVNKGIDLVGTTLKWMIESTMKRMLESIINPFNYNQPTPEIKIHGGGAPEKFADQPPYFLNGIALFRQGARPVYPPY